MSPHSKPGGSVLFLANLTDLVEIRAPPARDAIKGITPLEGGSWDLGFIRRLYYCLSMIRCNVVWFFQNAGVKHLERHSLNDSSPRTCVRQTATERFPYTRAP